MSCILLSASSSSSKKSKKDSKRKEKRAKKDPDAPKRAVSAYLLFSQDSRPQLKKEQPDLTFGAVAKELARRWADADPQTREVRRSALTTHSTRLNASTAPQPPHCHCAHTIHSAVSLLCL